MQLYMEGNQIGNEGCKYLSRAKMPSLIRLDLQKNGIEKEGWEYLTRSQWKKLIQIWVSDNVLGYEGIRLLGKANWPALFRINHDNRDKKLYQKSKPLFGQKKYQLKRW